MALFYLRLELSNDFICCSNELRMTNVNVPMDETCSLSTEIQARRTYLCAGDPVLRPEAKGRPDERPEPEAEGATWRDAPHRRLELPLWF